MAPATSVMTTGGLCACNVLKSIGRIGLMAAIVRPNCGANSDRLRFVDEHDRYALLDLVAKLAGMAQQGRLRFPVLELTFAFRAHENFEQLRRQTHGACSLGSL